MSLELAQKSFAFKEPPNVNHARGLTTLYRSFIYTSPKSRGLCIAVSTSHSERQDIRAAVDNCGRRGSILLAAAILLCGDAGVACRRDSLVRTLFASLTWRRKMRFTSHLNSELSKRKWPFPMDFSSLQQAERKSLLHLKTHGKIIGCRDQKNGSKSIRLELMHSSRQPMLNLQI